MRARRQKRGPCARPDAGGTRPSAAANRSLSLRELTMDRKRASSAPCASRAARSNPRFSPAIGMAAATAARRFCRNRRLRPHGSGLVLVQVLIRLIRKRAQLTPASSRRIRTIRSFSSFDGTPQSRATTWMGPKHCPTLMRRRCRQVLAATTAHPGVARRAGQYLSKDEKDRIGPDASRAAGEVGLAFG